MVWSATQVKAVCIVCLLINSFFLAHNAARGNRASLKSGWVLDVVYGVECFINILTELLLFASLMIYERAGPEGAENLQSSLRIFLLWATISVVACYGANIRLTHSYLKAEQENDVKDKGKVEIEFFHKLSAYILTLLTITAAIKVYVVYSIYEFYQNIVHVSNLQQLRAPLIVQASPGLVLPYEMVQQTVAVNVPTAAPGQYTGMPRAARSQSVQLQAAPVQDAQGQAAPQLAPGLPAWLPQ